MAMIFKEAFGTTKTGIPVDRYSMTNQAGMQVDILTYGAAIQKILIPVGDGRYTDVALVITHWRITKTAAATTARS